MRSEEKALQITNKEICGKNGLGVARGKSRDRKERKLSEERGKDARRGGGGGMGCPQGTLREGGARGKSIESWRLLNDM